MTHNSLNTRHLNLITKMAVIGIGLLLATASLNAARTQPQDSSVLTPFFSDEQKLTSSQSVNFGFTIASSGSTIVVGARGDNIFQGAAYVFERQGGSWVETQRLTASDGGPVDEFSDSVAVSGSTIVVGATNHWVDGVFQQGAAYVFERQGGSWVETQKLTASDGAMFDNFGRSAAVSGSTIVVGSANKNAAYVFERRGGSWVETQKLTASDPGVHDGFAVSVAISGSTIVVGSSFADVGAINQGAAYVFERRGGSWVETQKLTASDGVLADIFGDPVAISGSIIVVGAAFDDVDGIVNQGSAYVFERRGGSWVETQKLTVSDGANSTDIFGVSVAVSGSTIVVGASLFDVGNNLDQGAAFVFQRRGGRWVETKLTSSDGAPVDNFGRSVAVSGSAVVVGAPFVGAFNQGAAYVFTP